MFLVFVVFSACSSSNENKLSAEKPNLLDNQYIDSLGEIAYSRYELFQADPIGFLAGFDNAQLDTNQREAYLWILINMGYGFQEHSRILRSTEYYEKALLYEEQNLILEDVDRLEFLYKPLANNYTILSDYQKAERLLSKALSVASDPVVRASFFNNLSLLLTAKQEHSHAKNAALSGIESLGALAQEERPTYESVLLFNALSNSYLAIDQVDSARYYNQKSLKQCAQSDRFSSGNVAALELKAKIAVYQKKYVFAHQAITEALRLEQQLFPNSRFREKAKLLNQLGWIEIARKNYEAAKEYLMQALTFQSLIQGSASQAISSYTEVEIYRNLGFVHARLHSDSTLYFFRNAVEKDFSYQQGVTSKMSHLQGNEFNRELLNMVFEEVLRNFPTPSQGVLIDLLWMTELTKGRMLWNSIRRSFSWENDTSRLGEAVEELQNLYALRDRLTDSLDQKELSQRIRMLSEKFELVEQYFDQGSVQPDFSRFQQDVLHSNSVQYSFFIHSDTNFSVFKIVDGEVSLFQPQVNSIKFEINKLKENYFSNSPHSYNQDPALYFSESQRLLTLLLPELPELQGLSSQHRVYSVSDSLKHMRISLDNELFMLPFDALAVSSSSFLVERYAIQYVNSFLIGELYTKKLFSESPMQILYRQEYEEPYVDLKFVEREVQRLDKEFAATLLPYQDLTSERLAHAFHLGGIVHIAAHAIIDTSESAKLLLNQPISTDQLRYYRIQAPLVVLSACNTASGTLLLSEGLESINRAFLSKGVPGVIATHWFANDDAMLDLTSLFYDYLKEVSSPVQALSMAKRSFLEKQSEAGKNPWYWAGMAYTGEDIKIVLPPKGTGAMQLFYGIISMVILVFMVIFRRQLLRFFVKKGSGFQKTRPRP